MCTVIVVVLIVIVIGLQVLTLSQTTVGQLTIGHVVNLASNDVHRFDMVGGVHVYLCYLCTVHLNSGPWTYSTFHSGYNLFAHPFHHCFYL